jgi:DNA-binding transcriptional LysR family regulator
MDLEELRSFLTVVEKGSFIAAAEALGVSRTTLRRRVRALEARAGAALVASTTQGVVLTEAGRLLAGRGKAIVEEAAALVASVRDAGREPSGELRVLLPVGMPPHLMATLFGFFRRTWPKLRVTCRFGNDPLREPLADVDMVVHFGDEPPRGAWSSQVVSRVREWLVASRTYLQRHPAPARIEDLALHDLLSWQPPGEDASTWSRRKGGTFKVRPILVSSDIHFVRQCCIEGHGIGRVPDAMLPDPGLRGGDLVPVLPDAVGRKRDVRISVPSALAMAPKVRALLDASLSVLGKSRTKVRS